MESHRKVFQRYTVLIFIYTHTHTYIYIYTIIITIYRLLWWLKSVRICLQCWRPRSNPWSVRSPGEGNDSPLQYSCLEEPLDKGAWWATVQGAAKVRQDLVTKSPTSMCVCVCIHTHTHTHIYICSVQFSC